MFTPHVKDKVDDATAVMQRQVRNSQTIQLDQVQRRNIDRQGSSSVEVEKMKTKRSEAERTHIADRETIPC